MENYKEIILSNEKKVQIKQFLPTSEKLALVDFVASASIDEDNIYNPIIREVNEFYALVSFYTDIDLDENEGVNLYEFYDECILNGDKSLILCAIPGCELIELGDATDELIKGKIKMKIDLSYAVSRFLNKLEEKIPSEEGMNKMIQSIGAEMKNISPENMEILTKLMSGKR